MQDPLKRFLIDSIKQALKEYFAENPKSINVNLDKVIVDGKFDPFPNFSRHFESTKKKK